MTACVDTSCSLIDSICSPSCLPWPTRICVVALFPTRIILELCSGYMLPIGWACCSVWFPIVAGEILIYQRTTVVLSTLLEFKIHQCLHDKRAEVEFNDKSSRRVPSVMCRCLENAVNEPCFERYFPRFISLS